jgi:hypothetical protein
MLRVGSQTKCPQQSPVTSSSSLMRSQASEADLSDVEPVVSVDKALMGEIHKTGAPCSMQTDDDSAAGKCCCSYAAVTASHTDGVLSADVDSSCKTRFVMELLTQLVAQVTCTKHVTSGWTALLNGNNGHGMP